MELEVTLALAAIIIGLLLIRQAKYFCIDGGFIKLIDDELLYLFFVGFPLSLIAFGLLIFLRKAAKIFVDFKIELKLLIWIMRFILICQLLIWSQLIVKLIQIL
jgi:hypothetical protein